MALSKITLCLLFFKLSFIFVWCRVFIVMLSVVILSAIILSVVILSVIMLSVIMLSVIKLNVAAPHFSFQLYFFLSNWN